MQYIIDAENIKCSGCASAIEDALGRLDDVEQVSVDIASGRVTVTATDGMRELIAATLKDCGYPGK
jgi:copper chaperone